MKLNPNDPTTARMLTSAFAAGVVKMGKVEGTSLSGGGKFTGSKADAANNALVGKAIKDYVAVGGHDPKVLQVLTGQYRPGSLGPRTRQSAAMKAYPFKPAGGAPAAPSSWKGYGGRGGTGNAGEQPRDERGRWTR